MHETDFEHEHPDPRDLGHDIEGMEMFTLKSVGIDIGSSTTHLVFSSLTLRREGAALSGRFKVAERKLLYRSPILLTPYLSGTRIDVESIKTFVHEAYREAGLSREDVDTGAVVITGEALKKENAQPIVELFARESGRFICASAGPHHEALLAAHGCGAVDLSGRLHAAVLNVDMGGGTTKFSWVEHGAVTRTASINIGARLVAFDGDDRVTRLEDAGRALMKRLGHEVGIGSRITAAQKEQLAELMAKVLVEMIERGPGSELAKQLMVTEPLQDYPGIAAVDHIVFSGGVSEHVYDRDRRAYGDLGPLLGARMRDYLRTLPAGKLREPEQGIRATVIGAGEYTVQASGSTSYLTNVGLLPVHALKVVHVHLHADDSVPGALRAALAKFDLDAFGPGLALSLAVHGELNYASLRRLAEGLAAVLGRARGCPLFLVLDQDIAKSLGGILNEELRLPNDIIAIDGIDVGDLDYIDIGSPMGGTDVIPVTVKSLLFPQPDRPAPA